MPNKIIAWLLGVPAEPQPIKKRAYVKKVPTNPNQVLPYLVGQHLLEMRRKDPTRFAAIMDNVLINELESKRRQKELLDAQLEESLGGGRGGNDNGIAAMVPDIVRAATQAFAPRAIPQSVPIPPPSPQPVTIQRPQPTPQPAPQEQRPNLTVIPQPLSFGDKISAARDPDAWLLGKIENASAEDTALWLAGIEEDALQKLGKRLCYCPDAERPALMQANADQLPRTVAWLDAHPDWFQAMIDTLRDLLGIGPDVDQLAAIG